MKHQTRNKRRLTPSMTKYVWLIIVVGAVLGAAFASMTTGSRPPMNIGPVIDTLAEKLYWSKGVITGSVNSSTVHVARGSSFSILVNLTYLEGRLSDHMPITLVFDAHQSQLTVDVTYVESGIRKVISLNDLVGWDLSVFKLTPTGSVVATMTVHVPSNFPTETVYFQPLFGYNPRSQIRTDVESIAMTVT